MEACEGFQIGESISNENGTHSAPCQEVGRGWDWSSDEMVVYAADRGCPHWRIDDGLRPHDVRIANLEGAAAVR